MIANSDSNTVTLISQWQGGIQHWLISISPRRGHVFTQTYTCSYWGHQQARRQSFHGRAGNWKADHQPLYVCTLTSLQYINFFFLGWCLYWQLPNADGCLSYCRRKWGQCGTHEGKILCFSWAFALCTIIVFHCKFILIYIYAHFT